MGSLWREILRILGDSAPYVLVGFLLAGLLDVVLSRYQRLTSVLVSRGRRPVFLAALLGAPLPLCSCGVLPAALTLRRQGASKGTMASFLISVPETDVTSITLTYALLGPIMAIARPAAAVVSAVTVGLVIDRAGSASQAAPHPRAEAGEPSPRTDPPEKSTSGEASPARDRREWWARAIRFGFVEMFDDIIVQLLIGIVLAGAIVTWLPALGLKDTVGHSPLAYFAMLAAGIPVYVCATASTPLALGFIAGGISPGAALVFLLVGPATNAASLIVLERELGRRVLALYVVAIAVTSVLLGVLLDLILRSGIGIVNTALSLSADGSPGWVETAATILLLGLTVLSIRRTRRLSTWLSSARRRITRERRSS